MKFIKKRTEQNDNCSADKNVKLTERYEYLLMFYTNIIRISE